ncbi:MAG TPA: hypothetical protein VFY13_08290 [Luteolibacter sp.]|nr:hypothetical protein [Luteolibacter sp.]
MSFDEAIEWSDEITQLIEQLEAKAEAGGLNRNERALLDVVETVRVLDPKGDGLHEFWQGDQDHRRVINSFNLVGASAVADVLTASQWCQTRPADRDEYSETEAEYLAEIEEELQDALCELPDLVEEFVEEELA